MSFCENHIFVICAYKESPYLEELIESLEFQTVRSHIIIATSTPCDFIQNIVEKYKMPCFVNEGESGITQDWNFGYKCARENYDCEYITIAHQDDYYSPTYTENMLMYMRDAKHPLIFFSGYFEIRDGEHVFDNKMLKVKKTMLLPLRIKAFFKSKWVRRRILSFGCPICCPAVTFAADNVPEVIFANNYRAAEDWEAWEMLSKYNGEFLYCPEQLVGHRIHEESETSATIQNNRRTQEEIEMFCKFWPKWIALLIEKQYCKAQNLNDLKKS